MFLRFHLGNLTVLALRLMLTHCAVNETAETTTLANSELHKADSEVELEDLAFCNNLIFYGMESSDCIKLYCVKPKFSLETQEIDSKEYESLVKSSFASGVNMCNLAFSSKSFEKLFKKLEDTLEKGGSLYLHLLSKSGATETSQHDEGENSTLGRAVNFENSVLTHKIQNIQKLIFSTFDDVWNGKVIPVMIEHLLGTKKKWKNTTTTEKGQKCLMMK